MDPLTAIGLVSNILSFIDFSGKWIKGAYDIYNSELGSTPDNSRSKELLDNIRRATDTLDTHFRGKTKHERSLREICQICRQQSDKLQSILKELTVVDKDSKWKSMKVSFKSIRKEKEIASIEKSLDSCRLQTLTLLGIIFSEQQSSANSRLDSILKECQRAQSDRTLEISDLIDELREAIKIIRDKEEESGSKTIQETARGTVEPSTHITLLLPKLQMIAQSIPRENDILVRLDFGDMYLRERAIKTAEDGTYWWIVKEESNEQDLSDLERDMRRHTRTSFLTWLRSGNSIYHVSGKIGSGKSTLMKFLCNNPCVQGELENWAGEKKLIFARFFFWNSGSRIQMSMEGLYRAILFQTLKKCPELIQQIFPDQWDLFDLDRSWSGNAPFCLDDVKAAFERLVNRKYFPNHRICFFIDGLDEYEGKSFEHWELAKSLQKWAQSQDIKICVSSRPHNQFMETFSDDPSLRVRLHELTQGDMSRFCRSAFENSAMFHRVSNIYQDFVEEIVKKAEGVFLWVVLVVQSLLDDIANFDPPSVLWETLNEIPETLNELFEKLLAKIKPRDRRRSDKMLLLASTFPLQRHYALVYSWLDDTEDPNFPFNAPVRGYTHQEVLDRERNVRLQLDCLTKGLLEMKPIHNARTLMNLYEDASFQHEVGFVHRSVREYLESTPNLSDIRSRLQGIDYTDIYCRLLLALSKFAIPQHYNQGNSELRRQNLQWSFEWFAGLQAIGKEPPIKIAEEFGSVLHSYRQLASTYPDHTASDDRFTNWGLQIPITGSLSKFGTEFSYLHFAAVFRQNQYVFQRVSMDAGALKTRDGLNLLLSAAITGNSQLVRFLLEEGASSYERVETEDMKHVRKPAEETPTVWLSFLLHFGASVIEGKQEWIWQGSFQNELEAPLGEYGLILEHFLMFGANPEAYFVLYETSTTSKSSGKCHGELKPVFVSLQQFVNAMRLPSFESVVQFFRRKRRYRISRIAANLIPKKDPLSESRIARVKEILSDKNRYDLYAICSKDGGCQVDDYIRLY
ncbi:hypothetical protein DTO271G3_3244 [Paecilomyces variotii]|nr:hypothetical protein DTO271G3_3244 [Paecilomyces variotii]